MTHETPAFIFANNQIIELAGANANDRRVRHNAMRGPVGPKFDPALAASGFSMSFACGWTHGDIAPAVQVVAQVLTGTDSGRLRRDGMTIS